MFSCTIIPAGIPIFGPTVKGARRSLFLPMHSAAARATCVFPAVVRETAPAFHRHSTTQTFFGSADLDIGPVRDGATTVGRVWAAAETRIAAEFRGQLAPWPQGASIVVELVDPAGAALASARVGSIGTAGLASTARQSGWHSFKTTASGLPPAGSPFELSVTYTATQEFSPR